MKHFVPLDVKTEKKFSPKIFMFDFFFIVGFAGFGWATQNIVIPALRTLYLVFCFAVGFFLSRPSQNNARVAAVNCGLSHVDIKKHQR